MSIKNSDLTSVVEYLEYKQAPYVGRVYKKRFPIGKKLLYLEKICEYHEENELRLMKATLDAALDCRKFFEPNQVFYSTLSAGVFALFFSWFSVSSSFMNSFIGFLSGPYLNSLDKDDKKMALDNMLKTFPSMFEEVSKIWVYIGIFVLIILITVSISMFFTSKNFNKISYYKSIIDQCLEIKTNSNN
jgi:hypothetical protein